MKLANITVSSLLHLSISCHSDTSVRQKLIRTFKTDGNNTQKHLLGGPESRISSAGIMAKHYVMKALTGTVGVKDSNLHFDRYKNQYYFMRVMSI